jgi:integrase/recombinase XerD
VVIVRDPIEADAPCLERSAEDYLTWLSIERGRSTNTVASYRRDLVAYQDSLQRSGRNFGTATRSSVEHHLDAMLARGANPASAARALSAIRGLYRFRADEEGDEHDPTSDIPAPTARQRLPKAISEEEVVRLIDAAAGSSPRDLRDRAMLELLYGTGMRISELVRLSLGDIGSDSGLMKVLGKGSKERLVPVGRYAEESLERWLDHGGRTELAPRRWARRGDAEALFINTRGGRLTRQGAWDIVARRARLAGLDGKVHPHVLRHSCATHMLGRGADVRVVQELLGHSSVATTQIYTRVTVEHLRSAYDSAHPRSGKRGKNRPTAK